jgi:LuxR family transcriptional regulator, regulator of acetate metabolism
MGVRSSEMSTANASPGADGLDATVDSGRVIAALERVRALLGPDAVPDLKRADGTDDASLAESVDVALMGLGDLVMSYTGPDALELTRTAYELGDLARVMRQQTLDRRVDGLSSVQRALAELRAVGSVELMLRRCTEVVCKRCGFDQAILFRVQDDTVLPASAFDRRDPDWETKVKQQIERLFEDRPQPSLDDMPLESEMARRRAPAIVHDAMHDPRTFKAIVEPSGILAYVAAPIAPAGQVIGFLHASLRYQSRAVDVIDRDVLWAFAEGCGYALERTLLQDQVRRQRARVRDLLHAADDLVTEIGESALQLEQSEGQAAVRSTEAPLPAGGSRIHSLLTPREIEVMELLVHGSTNRQIAERLVVAEATAKSHVTHIFRKLHAANRAEAVHRYMRLLNLDQR